MKIFLKNNENRIKKSKLGFSFTTLFFGPFVPLLRADFFWTLIMLCTYFVVGYIQDKFNLIFLNRSFTLLCIWFVINLVFAFIYNRNYVKTLLLNGFMGYDEENEEKLKSKNMSVTKEQIEEYQNKKEEKRIKKINKRQQREEKERERLRRKKEAKQLKKEEQEKKNNANKNSDN